MILDYQNLDAETRKRMVEEIQRDNENASMYMSGRLSPGGLTDYPDLLESAAHEHDDTWLAEQLNSSQRMKEVELYERGGKTRQRNVPVTAPSTLAMGEFNRYYVRALCHRAIDENRKLVVYRARQASSPRPESEALIGKEIDPQKLLDDLRNSPGVEPALGVPPGPNSGLTVKLA